jgi:signal transduction histidine kinase
MKKKYIPNKSLNRIVQAKKIDELAEKIENHRRELEIVIKSNDSHVEYLANFAQHDMKNTLQSMDSVLFNTDYKNITEEEWLSLKMCLKNIRNTFESFSKLITSSKTTNFTIGKLINGLEVLTRHELSIAGIKAEFCYPRESQIEINLPFQSVLQMLHNILINAMKALETTEEKYIHVDVSIDEYRCLIKISDTGEEIPEIFKDSIFEYGFTSTGGTGIGLYHAKYVCEKINGEIVVFLNPNPNFTKQFIITIPIKISNED